MEKQRLQFPKGFLWGAATAGHQIEGNNVNSDWWAWEHGQMRENALRKEGKNPAQFYSGIACDSFNRFDEDFGLAQYLNHNATRLSIEWARIEPREGEYNEKALDHYEKVLQSAKFHGFTTFVTLHHFTSPLWFARKGGFAEQQNIDHFVRYVKLATKRLSQYTDFWLTFNEPEIYSNLGFLRGRFPPQIKSVRIMLRVIRNIISAHNLCSEYIRHEIRQPVSIAYHLSDLQPTGFFGHLSAGLAHYIANRYILSRTINACDFIGVNYYFHHHIGLFGKRGKSQSGHEETDLGWGIHPEGLERVLTSLIKYKKPIYITENGLADAHDTKREKFIKDHLYFAHRAIKKGADVRGYLYWSLIDNFEWDMGYGPRFGLIAINRESLLERKIRYSALKYGEICKNNYLEY